MSNPDTCYLGYLEGLVGSRSYTDLLRQMLRKEFVWFVPNDDNRVVDGLDIRSEWFEDPEDAREFGPCSFLEVLIGLSRRMEFMMGETAQGWAWQLLTNLELHRMEGHLSRYKINKIDTILDIVIHRTYQPNGWGGFFPLSHPKEDQREVEIWQQLSAYVIEIHPDF